MASWSLFTFFVYNTSLYEYNKFAHFTVDRHLSWFCFSAYRQHFYRDPYTCLLSYMRLSFPKIYLDVKLLSLRGWASLIPTCRIQTLFRSGCADLYLNQCSRRSRSPTPSMSPAIVRCYTFLGLLFPIHELAVLFSSVCSRLVLMFELDCLSLFLFHNW